MPMLNTGISRRENRAVVGRMDFAIKPVLFVGQRPPTGCHSLKAPEGRLIRPTFGEP